jgi:hypothetical protein
MKKMSNTALNNTFLWKLFMKLASTAICYQFPHFLPQSETNLPRAKFAHSCSIPCLMQTNFLPSFILYKFHGSVVTQSQG